MPRHVVGVVPYNFFEHLTVCTTKLEYNQTHLTRQPAWRLTTSALHPFKIALDAKVDPDKRCIPLTHPFNARLGQRSQVRGHLCVQCHISVQMAVPGL